MKQELRSLLLLFASFSIFFLSGCQTTPISVRQHTPAIIGKDWKDRKAIAILSADIREQTNLRDNIPHFGSVFFSKVDDSYDQRGEKDYDFAIQYTLSADWKAVGGGLDENRTPRLFLIDPGIYVIEAIEIGSSPKTIYRGYESNRKRVNYGTFEVRAGELINLGRLVIHMHYYERIFSQKIEDNTEEVSRFLVEKYPDIQSKLEKRFLTLVPGFKFKIR